MPKQPPKPASDGNERQRPVFHPCCLRLNKSAAITVTSRESLVSAGYASIAMALFSIFRVTPFLLFFLDYHFNVIGDMNFSKALLYSLLFIWIGLMMLVLVVFGIVLTCSLRIKQRWPLLLHPWGLLLLYFDVFVWISLILYMHMQVLHHPHLVKRMFDGVYYPLVYFIIMYVECTLFATLYYLYATYFIAAELTVIEKYF